MESRFIFFLYAYLLFSLFSVSIQGQEKSTETAASRFQAKVSEWKDKLEVLRELSSQFTVAEDDKVAIVRKEFNDTVAAAEALIPGLRETGLEAYRESPNTDRELSRFLMKMAFDYKNKDDYVAVKEITDTLIEGDADYREIWNLAGIAAFINHDFDAAKKYLTEAESLGTLEKPGTEYLPVIDEVKKLWEEEQKIRTAEAEADDLPRVKLTTTKGEIVLELFENEAPETVGNFISLVEKGFYTDLTFHRVLPGFMAQAGCPNGDGTGGPGYRIFCEAYEENARSHWTGSLSMAKGQERDSGGSQFFITIAPTTHLNGIHTVFGRVIEGFDVVAKLKRRDPDKPEAAQIDPDRILSAEVLRKRDHEYVPNKAK